MKFNSKYTIGSEQGVSDFISIIDASITALHTGFIDKNDISKYVKNEINPRKIINDLNNLSNQLIIAYANNKPAGFCMIKSGSYTSQIPTERKAAEVSLAILNEFDTSDIRLSLWNKCRSALMFSEIVWTNIMVHDPTINFLKDVGFSVLAKSSAGPFLLPSYIMAMDVNNHP